MGKLTAALGACAALTLAGCGSSDDPEGDPLPSGAVAQLQTRLDEIERRYQDAVDNGNVGACEDIGTDSMPAIEDVIARLPESVDPELREAVDQSFARLRQLADDACADIQPVETVPEPVPVPEPEPVPEEDTSTEEVPTETVPQEEPPSEENGNGIGNGGTPPGQEGGGIEAPSVIEEDE